MWPDRGRLGWPAVSSNDAVRGFMRRLVTRYGVTQAHLARLIHVSTPQFNKWLNGTTTTALDLNQIDILAGYCARLDQDLTQRPYALKRPASLTADPPPDTSKTKDPPPAELPRRSKAR